MKTTQLATHSDCLTLALYKEWWACILNRERVKRERLNMNARYERFENALWKTEKKVSCIEALLGRVE